MPEKEMSALEKGRKVYLEKIKKGEIKRLNPMEKAAANPKSMRLAINANCYDCCGRDNWVKRTRECHIFDCPFYQLRPHK